jgi:hypothetical protein
MWQECLGPGDKGFHYLEKRLECTHEDFSSLLFVVKLRAKSRQSGEQNFDPIQAAHRSDGITAR